MQIFLTSDTHFGHANIIRYCKRPFANAPDMDAALIKRWNAVVRPEDKVYHLGDLTLGDGRIARKILSRLNGEIHILGYDFHHDARWLKSYNSYKGESPIIIEPHIVVLDYADARSITDEHIVLCHFPLSEWPQKHHGSYHFHGHTHGIFSQPGRCIDVGVDSHDYAPIPIQHALELADDYRDRQKPRSYVTAGDQKFNVECPNCGALARYASSKEVYEGRDYGMIYVCTNYPECDSYVGVHAGTTTPKGTLANSELREWRRHAHAAFDPIWQRGNMKRGQAYARLAERFGFAVHIGASDIDQCQEIIEFAKEIKACDG